MHKYRCPHCGEKTISLIDRIKSLLYLNKGGRICCYCRKRYSNTINLKSVGPIIILLGALGFIAIPGIYRLIDSYTVKISVLIAETLILIATVMYTLLTLKTPIKQLQEVENDRIYFTVPHMNTTVKLNSNKIIPYWVYGAKFDENCNDAVFTERFNDGMVPMMFLSKNTITGLWDVAVLDKQFVPEKLLRVGAEFTLEDNGKSFCRGVVNTVVEEQND